MEVCLPDGTDREALQLVGRKKVFGKKLEEIRREGNGKDCIPIETWQEKTRPERWQGRNP